MGYRDIMLGLATSKHDLPLRAMVNRLLTRADLSCKPAPHMGMALECYTNCTSPLRKYVDFLVHLQIKAGLHGGRADQVDEETLANLKLRLNASRTATLEAERWLASKYLKRIAQERVDLTQAAGESSPVFKATITHITSSGFTARLDDNGLTGFVDLRKDPEKFSYDKWTASLTSTTRRFQLNQAVELNFVGVDTEVLYQSLFKPIPGCGLKPVNAKD
jgi:ribonuclease R